MDEQAGSVGGATRRAGALGTAHGRRQAQHRVTESGSVVDIAVRRWCEQARARAGRSQAASAGEPKVKQRHVILGT